MIASLELTGAERVLEIGTGLGFQTALLSRLAAEVVTIERWSDLSEEASQNLIRQGIANVTVLVRDGSRGAPEHGP